GEVIVERDKAIDVASSLFEQSTSPTVMRLGELFEKDVFASQTTDHRYFERVAERWNNAGQQYVGDVHDVRLHVSLEPGDQVVDCFTLPSLPAFERRDGQFTELGDFHPRTAAREPIQEPRRIQQRIEEPRRMAKQRRLLLQINIHAAKEHTREAD